MWTRGGGCVVRPSAEASSVCRVDGVLSAVCVVVVLRVPVVCVFRSRGAAWSRGLSACSALVAWWPACMRRDAGLADEKDGLVGVWRSTHARQARCRDPCGARDVAQGYVLRTLRYCTKELGADARDAAQDGVVARGCAGTGIPVRDRLGLGASWARERAPALFRRARGRDGCPSRACCPRSDFHES